MDVAVDVVVDADAAAACCWCRCGVNGDFDRGYRYRGGKQSSAVIMIIMIAAGVLYERRERPSWHSGRGQNVGRHGRLNYFSCMLYDIALNSLGMEFVDGQTSR